MSSKDRFVDPGSAPDQRPRAARVKLPSPLSATIDSKKAAVLEISLSGALVAHPFVLEPGTTVILQFDWQGEQAIVQSSVARTEKHPEWSTEGKTVFRTGLNFQEHFGFSSTIIRGMVEGFVSRALDEMRANMKGIPPLMASSFQTGRGNKGYLRLTFNGASWNQIRTTDPAQPPDGFTVSADEDPDQVKMLCTTYERAGAMMREMIRTTAALSVENESGIPARKYEP